jgi:PPM family protein phosphatase
MGIEKVIADDEMFELTEGIDAIVMVRGARTSSVYGRMGNVEFAVTSNIGGRNNNQDAYAIHVPSRTIVIPDGMGGHADGAYAAEVTARAVVEPVISGDTYSLADRLVRADLRLKEHNLPTDTNRFGSNSGATVSGMTLTPKGLLMPAHVGDGRIGVYDASGNLQYVTKDQSYLQELIDAGQIADESTSRMSNIVKAYIGQLDELSIDREIYEVLDRTHITPRGRLIRGANVRSHPFFKLCTNHLVVLGSDGLWDQVGYELIGQEVTRNRQLYDSVNALVNLANKSNNGDNVTIGLARYTSSEGETPEETPTAEIAIPEPPTKEILQVAGGSGIIPTITSGLKWLFRKK